MIVDFHLHVPEGWVKEGVPPKVAAERLLQFMDESGIDVGVILPIAPYVPNDYVYKVVSHEPRRLVGFASVVPNPADIAVRELRRAIRDLGLRGLKLHPGMQGFCICHPHVIKVLGTAGELGVPVVIHAMKVTYRHYTSGRPRNTPYPRPTGSRITTSYQCWPREPRSYTRTWAGSSASGNSWR